MVCSRCGRAVQTSRCLTCGGAPVGADTVPPAQQRTTASSGAPILKEAHGRSTTATGPSAGSAGHDTPEPADPRIAEAERRIRAQQERIADLERRVRATTESLETALGVLRADVDAAVSASERALAADLATIAADRQVAIAQLDHDDLIRQTRLGNAAVTAGINAREAAKELQRRSPTILRPALDASDLCPALTVRPYAAVGTVRFPEVGALDRQTPTLPALLPLINEGHVVVEGPSGDPQIEAMLTNLVAQSFAAAPGGQIVVTVFDPKMKSTLAGFQAHGASTEAKVFVNVHPSYEALERVLAEHLGHMIAVSASIARQYATLGDLVTATGQHEHQYRALVILDAPSFWNEKIGKDLERIIDQGAAAGVSVILHHDPAEPKPHDLDFEKIVAGAARVRRPGAGDWTLAVPGVKVVPAFTPLPAPSLQAQQRLMELVVGAAREGVLPKVPVMELVDGKPWWTGRDGPRTTADGVRIVLGRKGNQPVSFTLGDTVSNLHNVLVGGRAGSGKTVLLKAMIYSMAARYSPDELRLFLLDYKEGVEFQQFVSTETKGKALPHAEVVSIESDAQFGLAVLGHFLRELKTRSELFKNAGSVQNIAEYRRRTGAVLPRWVLLIDEFQGVFAGPGYVEATAALEDLVRRGRSFGLHVVLASQTLSGIRFDGDKDKAIFENVPARIVLQLGPDEATKFLQSGNDGAAQLRYRGQAILNTQGGAAGENQQFVVAFGDEEYFDLQDRLAAAAERLATANAHRGHVYKGDQYVSTRDLLERNGRPRETGGALPTWFGQESTVVANAARSDLSTTSGSNLLVLGSLDVPAAIATVQAAVLTAAAAANGLKVLLFEALLPQVREQASIDRWAAALHTLRCRVEHFTAGDETSFMDAIRDAAQDGTRTLAVLVGAENSDFKSEADADWDDLIRGLPRKHVNVIGHWSDLRDMPGDGYNLRSDFKTILFVGGDEPVIEQASGLTRHDIPPLKRSRTVVFSATSAQRGLGTVASVQPLDERDFAAWEDLA